MGKHLHELMGWDGPMTYLQWLVWDEWQFQEMNDPQSLTHVLLNVIAAEVRQKFNRKRVRLADVRPKFKRGQAKRSQTLEEKAQQAKAAWFARVGVKEDDIYVDEQGRTRLQAKKPNDRKRIVPKPVHKSLKPKSKGE